MIDSEKKQAVNQLLNLNRNMENLDKEIGEMKIELRQMRKQKDELQSELIEMGLNEN